MIEFTIAITPGWKGKHLALVGKREPRHRSLCGYRIVPHPDGEASIKDWRSHDCADCAGLAHMLTKTTQGRKAETGVRAN